jgi:uncharacterized protein (DUF2147 family)
LVRHRQQIQENQVCLGDFTLFRLWLVAAWLCSSVAFAHAAGAAPIGRWFMANHTAVIQIAPCGKNLCGQIVGIVLAHPGDPMPLDWLGHPQCGMTILQTAPIPNTRTGDTDWVGTVLDPRNGNVYRASIALDNARRLRLHGYLGLPIFGLTQTWDPYPGHTLANCKLAPGNGPAPANS